jgi:hypothetical protein
MAEKKTWSDSSYKSLLRQVAKAEAQAKRYGGMLSTAEAELKQCYYLKKE